MSWDPLDERYIREWDHYFRRMIRRNDQKHDTIVPLMRVVTSFEKVMAKKIICQGFIRAKNSNNPVLIE